MIGVAYRTRLREEVVLDTHLIARHVELNDWIIPASRWGRTRSGPGCPSPVTDVELLCLAVTQVLLRYNDEHHWLRAASSGWGMLFPRPLGQSEYYQRLKDAAPLWEAQCGGWPPRPRGAKALRLTNATPNRMRAAEDHCAASTHRSDLDP